MTKLFIGGAEEAVDALKIREAGLPYVHLSAKRLIHNVKNFEKSLYGPRLQHIQNFPQDFEEVLLEFDKPYDIIDLLQDYVDIFAYHYSNQDYFESIDIDKRCPILTKWESKYSDYSYIGIWSHAPETVKKTIIANARKYKIKVFGGAAPNMDDIREYGYDIINSSRWLSSRTFGNKAVFVIDRIHYISNKKDDHGLIRAACIKHGINYGVVKEVRAGNKSGEIIAEIEKLTLGAFQEWMVSLQK